MRERAVLFVAILACWQLWCSEGAWKKGQIFSSRTKTNEYQDDSFPFESWPLHAWYICLHFQKNQASVDTYYHFPWILWVGKERWKNILTSILFHFFHMAGFSNCPTFVVQSWRRDVPLGTLLMVHSPAHHQNSLNSGTVLMWFCFIFIRVKYISYFSVFSPFSLGCVSFSYFKGFIGKKKTHAKSSPKNSKVCRMSPMPLTPLLGAFGCPGVNSRALRS